MRNLPVFLLSFAMALSALSLGAQAKGGGGGSGGGHSSSSSGSTHSFSSFSSPSKSSAAPSAAPSTSTSVAPAQKSAVTSFGSFGSSKPAAAPAPTEKPTSALSANLDKNGAQNAALKTLDARNIKTNEAVPAAGLAAQSGQAASGGVRPETGFGPGYNPGYSSAPPVVYNNGSSSNGLMWFMLGHSMSGGQRDYGRYDNNQGSTGSYGSNSSSGPKDSSDSAGLIFLRILAWIFVLGLIGGVVWFFVNRSRNRSAAQASRSNYSL